MQHSGGRFRGIARELGEEVVFDPLARWGGEHEVCIKAMLFHRYGITASVQPPVVVAAQGHQVIQTGFPAVGPVVYMMSIDISRFTAAGKAAGFVTLLQGAANRGWNGAAAPPHVEYLAVIVLQDGKEAGIAAQAPGCCR